MKGGGSQRGGESRRSLPNVALAMLIDSTVLSGMIRRQEDIAGQMLTRVESHKHGEPWALQPNRRRFVYGLGFSYVLFVYEVRRRDACATDGRRRDGYAMRATVEKESS